MARLFPARYPGKCAGCCRRIHPGETVTYINGALVHDMCTDDLPTTSTAPVSICWDCWQERAADRTCGCDD